jgi:hypothetical protein
VANDTAKSLRVQYVQTVQLNVANDTAKSQRVQYVQTVHYNVANDTAKSPVSAGTGSIIFQARGLVPD